MKKWTDFHDIKLKLEKKWNSGEILRDIVEEKGLFPYRIKINGPNSNELSLEFERAIQWIQKLRDKEKSRMGYGYFLEEKEINFRIVEKISYPFMPLLKQQKMHLDF